MERRKRLSCVEACLVLGLQLLQLLPAVWGTVPEKDGGRWSGAGALPSFGASGRPRRAAELSSSSSHRTRSHEVTYDSVTHPHTHAHSREHFPNSDTRIYTRAHAHTPTYSYTIVIFCTAHAATKCTCVHMYTHTLTHR